MWALIAFLDHMSRCEMGFPTARHGLSLGARLMPKSSDAPAHRPFTVAPPRAAQQRRARPQTAGFASRVHVRKAPGTSLDPTALLRIFFIDRIRGQNNLGFTAASFTANPVALTDMDVSECLARRAELSIRGAITPPCVDACQGIAGRLCTRRPGASELGLPNGRRLVT